VGDILAIKLEWVKPNYMKNTMQASAVLGLMIGAIFSKSLLRFGLRRLILMCNLIMTLLTVPYFFLINFYYLCISRSVFGFCSAVIINATATIIGDAVPNEY